MANSCLAVSWWSGWRGPGGWPWGELPAEQREKWERHDQSFVALAAMQWENSMSAQREAKQRISLNSLLGIRYEGMCQDPMGTFRLVAEFCGLEWSPHLEAAIQGLSLKSTNYKWQEQLSAEQRRILNECLCDTLREYGYV
ncbi:sulfotransferase [Chloroflexota bacterium]